MRTQNQYVPPLLSGRELAPGLSVFVLYASAKQFCLRVERLMQDGSRFERGLEDQLVDELEDLGRALQQHTATAQGAFDQQHSGT